MILTNINQINQQKWCSLVSESITGSWFQTPEAYEFYKSVPSEFAPFVVAVLNTECPKFNGLRGVCVGFVTVSANKLRQKATCRCIINGGPVLADDCTDEEVEALMRQVRAKSEELGAIYIETRNFNDYSTWTAAFAKAGFQYKSHYNVHVDTSSAETAQKAVHKSRMQYIKTSYRDGVTVIDNPSVEQVREYYLLLKDLYQTKVKTPLYSLDFFEKLWAHKDGRFLLVELNGEIIGGTVCVAQEGKCLYEWFVCKHEQKSWKTIFPAYVATYAGIQYAATHNMPRFDMMGAGRPGDKYNVRDFKLKFGGKEVEHGRFMCVCKPLLYKIGTIGVALLKKL